MRTSTNLKRRYIFIEINKGNLNSLPENVAKSFNQTLGYFRSSHDSPLVKKRESLPKPESADERGIEYHLTEEIDKFNKLKLQKQVLISKFMFFVFFKLNIKLERSQIFI